MNHDSDIRILEGQVLAGQITALAEILLECIQGGASMGFMSDFTRSEAEKFWSGVAARSDRGELVVFGAFVQGVLAGTVTLVFSSMPNQVHKADISKLIVSPKFQRRGLALALMSAAEVVARKKNRDVLVLDTLTGSPAELFYENTGWLKVGEIPRFAQLPEGGDPLPTSFFYKDLRTDRN